MKQIELIFIEPALSSFFSIAHKDAFEGIVRCFGLEIEHLKERSTVVRKTLQSDNKPPLDVHFKLYTYRKYPWQRLWRRSKACLEARHLKFFGTCGIPVPQVVGWGQRHIRGLKLSCEFLITKTLPNALPLKSLLQKCLPDHKQRAALIRNIALNVRTLHARNFFHQDLKWRNLLVTQQPKQAIEVYWIDCPNGYWDWSGLRRRHGRIKDLATLDKVAKDLCSF